MHFKRPLFIALFSCFLSLHASSSSIGYNLYTEGDWIFWKAYETGLGYALNQEEFNPTAMNVIGVGEISNPKCNWASGFRVGIGYHIPQDRWDMLLLWSTYGGGGKTSIYSNSTTEPTIFPSFIHPNAYNDEEVFSCFNASTNLSIEFNQLELSFTKPCPIGKNVLIKPHFGIRGTWIKQDYTINYLNLYAYDPLAEETFFVLDEYNTLIKNDFSGLGISGGIASEWFLRSGFSLFADLSGALLYGLFDTAHTENVVRNAGNIEAVVLSLTNNFHAGRAILDIAFGLRFASFFNQELCKLVLQAGWEQHSFFSQGEFLRFTNGKNWGNFVQTQSDLYFQGLGASIAFYF